jgi:hypothetical protein
MNYRIFTYPQVSPQYIVAHGAIGEETVLNPGGPVELPPGTPVYKPGNYNIYAADSAQRTILYADPAGTATSAEIFNACPGCRNWRADQIRNEGSSRLSTLAGPYQGPERETWSIQMTEAEAWLINMQAPTPLLTALAVNRGITIDALVGKVMENVQLFRAVSGVILGQQQALLDRIYTTQNITDLLAITWG